MPARTMPEPRYQLSRWGNTRFEVVDSHWKPCARSVAILFGVSLTEAQQIVDRMNSEHGLQWGDFESESDQETAGIT